MISFEVGDLVESTRDHFAFRRDGTIVILEKGEWLIIVQMEYFQGVALRISTDEYVTITFLEMPTYDVISSLPTYKKVLS